MQSLSNSRGPKRTGPQPRDWRAASLQAKQRGVIGPLLLENRGAVVKTIRTHYDNLQVKETASLEVIKGAYRSLQQKWHPDRNLDDPIRAQRVARIINEAYRVLSDPELRRQHDDWILRQRQSAEPQSPAKAQAAPASPAQPANPTPAPSEAKHQPSQSPAEEQRQNDSPQDSWAGAVVGTWLLLAVLSTWSQTLDSTIYTPHSLALVFLVIAGAVGFLGGVTINYLRGRPLAPRKYTVVGVMAAFSVLLLLGEMPRNQTATADRAPSGARSNPTTHATQESVDDYLDRMWAEAAATFASKPENSWVLQPAYVDRYQHEINVVSQANPEMPYLEMMNLARDSLAEQIRGN